MTPWRQVSFDGNTMMFSVRNSIKGFSVNRNHDAAAIGGVIALGMSSIFANMFAAQNAIKIAFGFGSVYRTAQGTSGRNRMHELISKCRFKQSDFDQCDAREPRKYRGCAGHKKSRSCRRPSASTDSRICKRRHIRRSVVCLDPNVLSNYVDKVAPQGEVTLWLWYRKAKQATSGSGLYYGTVRLSTTRDLANKLTSCVAMAKMSDGLWTSKPQTTDNIYFLAPAPGGNVGIGNSAPQFNLDIQANNAQADFGRCQ